MTTASQNTPAVSVLTTCYNRADYIGQTIESVLASTFEDFEYIIVDDCSTDGSYDIAREFAARDSRIRAIRNETNLGDYPNRNEAASQARGRYLKYIDSDDILYPHALHVFVHYMDQTPEAGLGLTKLHTQEHPLPELLSPRESYQRHFLQRDLFGNAPGSVMIRRETFERAGRFSGARYIGDFEMWLALGRIAPVLLLPGLLAWDRKHGDQESSFDELDYAGLRHQVAREALAHEDCPLEPEERDLALQQLRHTAARVGLRSCVRSFSFRKPAQFLRENECGLSDLLAVSLRRRPALSFPAPRRGSH